VVSVVGVAGLGRSARARASMRAAFAEDLRLDGGKLSFQPLFVFRRRVRILLETMNLIFVGTKETTVTVCRVGHCGSKLERRVRMCSTSLTQLDFRSQPMRYRCNPAGKLQGRKNRELHPSVTKEVLLR
jgi:hypothetical protein